MEKFWLCVFFGYIRAVHAPLLPAINQTISSSIKVAWNSTFSSLCLIFDGNFVTYFKVNLVWLFHLKIISWCIFVRLWAINTTLVYHDDVIKWKHFPRNWPFVRGIHRSRWIPHTKASDAELWFFCLICVWINDWVNNREAGDLRRYRGHYDVTVMWF